MDDSRIHTTEGHTIPTSLWALDGTPAFHTILRMKDIDRTHLQGRLYQALRASPSIRKAAKAVGIPKSTAWEWKRKMATRRHQPSPFLPRRQGASDMSHDALCYQLLSDGTASDAARQLHEQGSTERVLHSTTVIRVARRHASVLGVKLRYSRGLPRKRLTARTKKLRLEFAHANQRTNWKSVMFTDRKKFLFRFPGEKVGKGKWIKGQEQHEASMVNHANGVNAYAGLTPFGLTIMAEVAGTTGMKTRHSNLKGMVASNITKAEYGDVLRDTLLPQGQLLFSQGAGQSSWVFQQDNDPAHKNAQHIINAWSKRKGSNVQLLMHWPPNSPDLNPIENVWAWMDAQLNKMGCSTFKEYQAAVHQVAKTVPRGMINKLYGSMAGRLKLVMQGQGEKTGY